MPHPTVIRRPHPRLHTQRIRRRIHTVSLHGPPRNLGVAAPLRPPPPPPAAATDETSAFNRLKQLKGVAGDDRERRADRPRYHVGSGGTMLTETQAPGSAEEMVSVYSINGSTLVMTDYCPMGPDGN